MSCLALAFAAASGQARAQATDPDWLGIAYLWGANITVDTRDQNTTIDFSDVVDKLEMGFMGHMEAQEDNFGGFVDLVFMAVGDNQTRQFGHLNTDLNMTAIDLAAVWSPGPERMTGLELYGGLRYIQTEFDLVFDPDAPALPDLVTGVDKNYTDLLIGARYIAPLSEQWRLTFTADMSGGDTEGTWSLGAFAGYRMGQHHFIAGYRHLDMEFKAGGGDEKLTQQFSGPLIAYGYSF